VFPSATGQTPIDSQDFMNRVFTPATKRAGIRDFRWNDLRQAFASRLVMNGIDIRAVQALPGQKEIPH
jgi:site-specific recombinase XerD